MGYKFPLYHFVSYVRQGSLLARQVHGWASYIRSHSGKRLIHSSRRVTHISIENHPLWPGVM